MKPSYLPLLFGILILTQCTPTETKKEEVPVTDFSTISQVESGKPVSVMLTSYSTTLLANGTDQARMRLAVTDSTGREITSAQDSIRIYVNGDGRVTAADGSELLMKIDTAGLDYGVCQLVNGSFDLVFTTGTAPDKVKVEAKADSLWDGGHEIHTIPGDVALLTPNADQLPVTTKPIDRMIGADISFLPQIENWGRKFTEDSVEVDGIELLKKHGFNYIRLRIFVNPENEKGYSPKDGFCGLDYTLQMAKRIKDAGMGFLLDYHYSDYWADPQQQNKPLAWEGLDYETLKDSLKIYTAKVLVALRDQGTMPDMVQIGNEINHGMVWPDGHIGNMDGLAGLLSAGVEGVNAVNPGMPIMMHIALGGQNDEAVFWLDNMIARGVKFDIIGLSYYPRWHGTLNDLQFNLNDLVKRYNKPLNVVEYSNYKKEVHDIVFGLPNNMGKGAAIWEPLGWRSGMFDREGETTDLISVYDSLNAKYLAK